MILTTGLGLNLLLEQNLEFGKDMVLSTENEPNINTKIKHHLYGLNLFLFYRQLYQQSLKEAPYIYLVLLILVC
jgi:hypothetical protein